MHKEMQKLLNDVNKIAEGRTTELNEIESRIEVHQNEIKEAQAEAAKAFEDMDVTGYHAAKDKVRTAKDAIEMLRAHYEKVKETPRMSKADYADTETRIKAEYKDTLQSFREQAAEHIKAAVALRSDLEQTWKAGRDALHTLQYDCMNDAPFVIASNGKKVNVPSQDKKLPEITLYDDLVAMIDSALKGADPMTIWNS